MDRNHYLLDRKSGFLTSLSARRAWIEISSRSSNSDAFGVALRKESVDRNSSPLNGRQVAFVALRKESVDRNYMPTRRRVDLTVALRKESVDRNSNFFDSQNRLSAVALRKESVDRNVFRGLF